MNIQAEKLGLNDSSIIEKLTRIHHEYSKTSDWWDEISEKDLKNFAKRVYPLNGN